MPQASVIARIARLAPIRSTMKSAIDLALPLTSITLPKIAPSRKSGKYVMAYLPSAGMKTCV